MFPIRRHGEPCVCCDSRGASTMAHLVLKAEQRKLYGAFSAKGTGMPKSRYLDRGLNMKIKKAWTTALLAAAITGLAGVASAQECAVTVDSTDAMQFDTDVIVVNKSCEEFTVTLTHSGKLEENVMGHNWVLAKAADVQAIATDGMSAGLEDDYLKPDDERVIANTEIIGGGEKASVTFAVAQLKADQTYTFFCSFPGHWSIMKGTLSLK